VQECGAQGGELVGICKRRRFDPDRNTRVRRKRGEVTNQRRSLVCGRWFTGDVGARQIHLHCQRDAHVRQTREDLRVACRDVELGARDADDDGFEGRGCVKGGGDGADEGEVLG
jgi:hypothetical protein